MELVGQAAGGGSNMVKYGQIWSDMVKSGQKWKSFDRLPTCRSNMVRWSNMVKYGQIWSNMVKYGRKWNWSDTLQAEGGGGGSGRARRFHGPMCQMWSNVALVGYAAGEEEVGGIQWSNMPARGLVSQWSNFETVNYGQIWSKTEAVKS